MKKIYTIITSFIILVLIVHIIYMTLSVMNIITINEDIAQNMGYTLMYASILHGAYGLYKWIRASIMQIRIAGHQKMMPAARKTMIQRILGIIILGTILPHGYIKVLSADVLPLIVDIIYIIALVIHVGIGYPKWMVSLGLCAPSQERNSVMEGGK